MAIVLAAAVAFLLAGTKVYVFPDEDNPKWTDATVVLGGLHSAPVVAMAIETAEAGRTGSVLISDAFGGDTRPSDLCARAIRVECFEASPGTTQGEARAIARFARERGWRSVLVITSTYHVSRARMLVERCYAGELSVAGARGDIDLAEWAYEYLYQTGAFLKAWAEPGC